MTVPKPIDTAPSSLYRPALTAAAVLLVSLKMAFLFSADPLAGWDTVGHLHLARTYSVFLGRFASVGYDPGWFDGFPAFTFYPPLFYFFVALLDRLLPFGDLEFLPTPPEP